jgi:NTP pyrophosphatase (non-canonical NTP hydrolase)
MNDIQVTLQQLKKRHADFVKDRDWNQFHIPKNLSMALAVEAAELMEKFQWVDNAQSWDVVKTERTQIEHEIADVLCYVVAFANACNIDLATAFENKMRHNEAKYPVDKAKGRSDKYTAYTK